MNKKIFAFLLLLLCGCSIKLVDTSSVMAVVDNILYREDVISNSHFTGFSMYIPQGVSVIDINGFALKIKDKNIRYYVYVDPIAYNYKVENKFLVNDEHFYSQLLNFNDKFGYIDIIENENNYFVVMMYNYTKIEAIVDKKEFDNSIVNMCYLLSSIKFNDNYITDYVGNKGNTYQEEEFNIFSSKKENKFLTFDDESSTD